MEEEELKVCPNCKRDIPVSNYTIHCIHCARNIKVCPVCKEPVPHSELDEHSDKLHKPLPCKQCGESVCGTDLEDHIRDSCANTIKTCRFCELEIPRREVPNHESYCGSRTEQCAECQQWVMIKYRQLHLDSNHGFLRLDDDPLPPKREPPKATIPKLTNIPKSVNLPSTSNGFKRDNLDLTRPRTVIRYLNGPNNPVRNLNDIPGTSKSFNNVENKENVASGSRQVQNIRNGNSSKVTVKRMNDQPQVNINVPAHNKVEKELVLGAVKKPAPPRPAAPGASSQSAIRRAEREKAERDAQNARNAVLGLPQVLTPAEKLDKLRKMDAVHNREVKEDYRNRLQGRVWMKPDFVRPGNALGAQSGNLNYNNHLAADRRRNERDARNGRISPDVARNELRGAVPMSQEQFMSRFQQMHVGQDRYSQIKTSLRELRRGLNEVTAPYNAANANANANSNGNNANYAPRHEEVRLPCEFCGELLPEQDLVQHQTGCRPDLAQLLVPPPAPPRRAPPAPRSPPAPLRAPPAPRTRPAPLRAPPAPFCPPVPLRAPPSPRASPPHVNEQPVIPCEFCSESLPVYLITEHQENCRREFNNSPYSD